ncbi:lipid kinase YegS [Lysobacter panacisoli]|uniref:Probable lipid kinase YegS-like n=1 Tax=Lysobacter panacisoli TaxID=1255263 RepID=A0ABP9L7C2_9GAMM|nr:lipid kinase YegS [Lysobacter panacisoli]
MTNHWRLILNGKSAGDDSVREAVGAMRDAGVALEVRVTWEHGDARRHVEEAIADGCDCVIAGGGDGTLGEVAAALAESADTRRDTPTLALVPLGTANDFATAAEIPPTPTDALRLVRETGATPIDLLRIDADGERRWCANLASGGFGTDITVETDDGLKNLLGGLAYFITGVARVGRIEPVSARLRGADFARDGAFLALGIGNGRQAGGGQVLCPDALVDDGLFDLTVVPELSGEVASTIATVLREGRHAALDRVAERARLRALAVESDEPLTLNLDGEPVQARRFSIECVPGAVRMHLPVDCPLLRRNASREAREAATVGR